MKKQYVLLAMMLFLVCSMYGQDSSVEARITSDRAAMTTATDFYERGGSQVPDMYEEMQRNYMTEITKMADEMRCSGLDYCDIRNAKSRYPSFFVSASEVEDISRMFSAFREELGRDRTMTGYVEVTNTLDRYFRTAVSLSYTKMEVFEDMTGFTDPLEFYGNYLDPSDRKRTINGRGMYESVDRLEGIADGRLRNTDCFTVNQRRITNPDKDVNPAAGQTSFGNVAGNLNLHAFPNPYSSEVNITFELPQKDDITLSVFDINGRLVKALSKSEMDKGFQSLTWNGQSDSGASISDGIYYVLIRSSTGSDVLRIVKKSINQN